MMLTWTMLHPRMTEDHLGLLPPMLNEEDPRSAKEQLDANYWPGWKKFDGFKFDPKTMKLKYPGDPEMSPLASTRLRQELILFYEHAWVLVMQRNGDWEVARMD